MNKTKLSGLKWAICAFLLSALAVAAQSGPPPLPPDPFLARYSFSDTNWLSDYGYAPIGFTNLVSVPEWYGSALLLDTTNEIPAFLTYNIVETDGQTNISFPAGAVHCIFICDWATADTNQNGTGPGDWAFVLAAGDFSSGSPDGLWGIYFDPGGTNIYFGGVSNSTSTVFVSAPISWPSNSIHLLNLYYSTNSVLFIDGQLAATGDPVTIIPATNAWTNGFFIGSDAAGFEQARGVFTHLELDNSNYLSEFGEPSSSNRWMYISNQYAAWLGSGGDGSDFSHGSLIPGGGGSCVTNTSGSPYIVYLTNMSYAVVTNQGRTFTFTISGGIPGVSYDVFSATNLAYPLNNSGWTWLGQGTNCGIYSVTNQPSTPSFFVLGTPLPASDGSGLTQAYENLIGVSSDGYGTPSLWYLWEGLSPVISGVAAGGGDADNDGLLNYQEYLYGTNPLVSEGFGVWVSEPGQTSGVP